MISSQYILPGILPFLVTVPVGFSHLADSSGHKILKWLDQPL